MAEHEGAPPVFGEREGRGGQTCTGLLDAPLELFEARVALQLPIGVRLRRDAGDRYVAEQQVAECAGARTITRVELREVADDPSVPLAGVREQLLDTLALPRVREVEVALHDEGTRHTRVVVHHRSAGERRSLVLELRGAAGHLYVELFECRSADYDALAPSFAAAFDSLVIAAPRG